MTEIKKTFGDHLHIFLDIVKNKIKYQPLEAENVNLNVQLPVGQQFESQQKNFQLVCGFALNLGNKSLQIK